MDQFEERKRDHLRLALSEAHQATGFSGLEEVHLHHETLPELDFDEVKTESPFFIAGMTAGHDDAHLLNERLAICAAKMGWIWGSGSLRRELEAIVDGGDATDRKNLEFWRRLRDKAPNLHWVGNLGITQVVTTPISKIQTLVEMLAIPSLVVHTNPLQEALQREGTPQFRGALQKLKTLCQELGSPVILKETGCGFSEETLKRIEGAGLAGLLSGIDVSGLGGTHWGRIEGARVQSKAPRDLRAGAAQTFANWGEPTVASVLRAKKILPAMEIWASGGVRSGLDAAKLIALGAHRVGYAKPALEAALQSEESLLQWMERQEFELKLALFCTGSKTPRALRQKEGVWTIQKSN